MEIRVAFCLSGNSPSRASLAQGRRFSPVWTVSSPKLKSIDFMGFKELFYDPAARIRSGWRFAIFVAGFVLLATICAAALSRLFPPALAEGSYGSAVYIVLFNLCILMPALLVGWLCNRYLDGLPFAALGASFRKNWFKHLVIGLALGALTLSIAVGIAAACGGESFVIDQVEWPSIWRTIVLSLVIFTVGAAAEEALCRGYLMQTFFHSKLAAFGIVFTAFIFASGHIGNPNSTLLSWLNTFLAGVWFGVAFWRTGSLWFPFGMHLMWNWMQGAFFGIEVSGLTDITAAPLLKEIDRGPAWLTGEAYGIEAGVACTVALIISTTILYFWPTRAKRDSLEHSDVS